MWPKCFLFLIITMQLLFVPAYSQIMANGSTEIEMRSPRTRRALGFTINLPSWFPRPWRQSVPTGSISMCLGELGCLGMGKPWTSALRPFPHPWDPNTIDVRVHLFTRSNLKGEEIKLWPTVEIQRSTFDSSRPRTVILTHGFASRGSQQWLHDMKDAYLQNVDANFFIVDWGNGAQHVNYLQVASNTRVVGVEISRLLKFLVERTGLATSKIHMIGHSLGSHIVAYAAKELKSIDRITALDPAQPGFELQSNVVRLSKDDANFVDVIHSDAKPIVPFLGFGMMMPVGHVDFYVNGGTLQPGCMKTKLPRIRSVRDLLFYSVEAISGFVTCSHSRATEYFINFLKTNCTLWGSRMSSFQNFLTVTSLGKLKLSDPLVKTIDDCTIHTCSFIGLDTPLFPARGSFLVKTTTEAPFCSTYSM